MTIPERNASKDQILSPSRTFFVTTNTSMGRALLQSERNATLLIDLLRSHVAAGKFQLHDFVIMPDHVHLLITVSGNSTIEKAMQFIKGGFSYRLKRELGTWQRFGNTAFPKCESRIGRVLCAIGSTSLRIP
jgi:putative transposase